MFFLTDEEVQILKKPKNKPLLEAFFKAIEIKERENFGKIYDIDQIDKMIFEIKKDLIDPNYNLINSESDLSSKIKTIFSKKV